MTVVVGNVVVNSGIHSGLLPNHLPNLLHVKEADPKSLYP